MLEHNTNVYKENPTTTNAMDDDSIHNVFDDVDDDNVYHEVIFLYFYGIQSFQKDVLMILYLHDETHLYFHEIHHHETHHHEIHHHEAFF